jgi:hypothetical protein
MTHRLGLRDAVSTACFMALGSALLGTLVAGCQARHTAATTPSTPAVQVALIGATVNWPAPNSPLDERPITSRESVGAAADD